MSKRFLNKTLIAISAFALVCVMLTGCSLADLNLSDFISIEGQDDGKASENGEATGDSSGRDLNINGTDTKQSEIYDGVSMWWKDEPFISDFDEKASKITDDRIKEALNALYLFKDTDRCKAYEDLMADCYTYDTTEYDTFSASKQWLFDKIVSTGRNFDVFSISEKDYKAMFNASLVTDYLTVAKPAELYDPFVGCYFTVELNGNDIRDCYFDPEKNENSRIAVSSAEDLAYVMDKMMLLDAVIFRIVNKMPEGLTDFEKYYYLAAVAALSAEYNNDFKNGTNISTAYGCLVDGACLCEGYSKALLLLCREADLSCKLVSGMGFGEGHMWNCVNFGESELYFDSTWAGEFDAGSPDFDPYMGMTMEECIECDHVF